jgi:hypothetical protein
MNAVSEFLWSGENVPEQPNVFSLIDDHGQSLFFYRAANEDSWVSVFTCSGPSGLAFEEKIYRNVFFER